MAVGKKKFHLSQCIQRQLELMVTVGMVAAMIFTGKNIAKAATMTETAVDSPNLAVAAHVPPNATTASSRLTVLAFGSKECVPCKELEGDIESAKQRYGEQISFVKVDVDDPATEVMQKKYQVAAVPAIFFLDKEGAVVHQALGYGGPEWFRTELNNFARTASLPTNSDKL